MRKKIIAFALAALFILALAIPALADTATSTVSATISAPFTFSPQNVDLGSIIYSTSSPVSKTGSLSITISGGTVASATVYATASTLPNGWTLVNIKPGNTDTDKIGVGIGDTTINYLTTDSSSPTNVTSDVSDGSTNLELTLGPRVSGGTGPVTITLNWTVTAQ